MEISGNSSDGLLRPRLDRPNGREPSAARRAQEAEQARLEERGELRQDVFKEVRRLPDADEEVEIAEVREERGDQSILVAVKVVKEKIPLQADEAARAQANLDPSRIAQLLAE
ncbi:hypothetical protein [Acanthopleuribacter pedis]|uniref:Uncharacterized protein n=1 Tax=Acanthopleuribacter pedis TaxID=442870 RepID=A0A8J7QCY8_9BACT|nr:hypothetical protein [Acanthopleuribacter pedis]MBO1321135.1 hypothetical protein [Acanthopleuribacter pedis]